MKIDERKCTGCGLCVSACAKQAITLRNKLAFINENACLDCGLCAAVCPSNAIIGAIAAPEKLAKGGEKMYYGYGRGFGLRGSSPAWPYVGRGRGGLPRCRYPGLYGVAATGAVSISPPREDELSFLKNQAETMKRDMADIERRIKELEKKD